MIKSQMMLSDNEKAALISKDIRAVLLNQPPGKRSYEEALQKHFGDTYNASATGQALKRKTAQAQKAVRDLALLAESLPAERFAAIFAAEEFMHLIMSVLGAGPLDERSKFLLKKTEQYRQSLDEYLQAKIDGTVTPEQEKELLEQRDELVMATNALNGVKPIAFDPLKAEIASKVAKTSLDCCVEQYKYVQKNPVTIGLYEEPIRKAASVIDVMVAEIKDNIEQMNLLQELHEYKAKKANRKRKGSNLADH
jgi:hypothetical protein